MLKDSSRS